MGEVDRAVIPFQVRYLCDDCTEGYQEFTGKSWANNKGAVHQHVCSNPACGKLGILKRRYPYIKYLPTRTEKK